MKHAIMIVVAVIAGFLGGLASGRICGHSGVVEATKFRLMTWDGDEAGSWEVDDNGAHLVFRDWESGSMAQFGMLNGGVPVVNLWGEGGKKIVRLGVQATAPSIELQDNSDRKGYVGLWLPYGSPRFALFDGSAMDMKSVIQEDVPKIALYDSEGARSVRFETGK